MTDLPLHKDFDVPGGSYISSIWHGFQEVIEMKGLPIKIYNILINDI